MRLCHNIHFCSLSFFGRYETINVKSQGSFVGSGMFYLLSPPVIASHPYVYSFIGEFSLQDWSFKCVIPFVHIFHSFIHLAFILDMLLKFILSNYELIVYLLIWFQSLHMSFCYTCVLFLPLLFNTVFYHIGLKKIFLKMCFCFLMSEWEGGWWGGNRRNSLYTCFSWTGEIYG